MLEDLTGQKFGKWTVLKRVENDKHGNFIYLCSCECGSTARKVKGSNLRSGHSKSCRCIKQHGMSNTRIYKIHYLMLDRCYNIKSKPYDRYGGRGIGVCQEWRDDFLNFYNWAMVNGYTDELTIDRKDVNGNYEPDNCRWATMKEQANNRTSNHYIEINGVVHNTEEWAEINNISSNTLRDRIKRGWTGSDLIIPATSKLSNKVKTTKIPKYKTGIQSGVKGITWNKELGKWHVRSFRNTKYLGCYENLDDAIKVKTEYEIANTK